MSRTPLSALLSDVLRDGSPEVLGRFHRGFLQASVGVEVQDLPETARPGRRIDASGATFRPVGTPDGRLMVRASADPDEFLRRFPDRRITGLMTGGEILTMMLELPDLDGVLVCSATSFHSVPIDRRQAATLLGRAEEKPAKRRWWRFWSR